MNSAKKISEHLQLGNIVWEDLDRSQKLGLALAVCIGFASFILIKRLYFHPLSAFNGPRCAALSDVYKFYYDLHDEYATETIRIGPRRLHTTSIEFFQSIYNTKEQYAKDPSFYRSAGIDHSIITILDPEEHRLRRAQLHPLFTSSTVVGFMPVVLEKLEKGIGQMLQSAEMGSEYDIQRFFRAFTSDVILEMCFGAGLDFVDSDDEATSFFKDMDFWLDGLHLWENFPMFFKKAILRLPLGILKHILPGYVRFRQWCGDRISEAGERNSGATASTGPIRLTALDLLLDLGGDSKYHKRSTNELVDEVFLLVAAGSDTTTAALVVTAWNLLNNEQVSNKLQKGLDEIASQFDGKLPLEALQNCEYLNAVIKEGLRHASPSSGILPRVVPQGATTVDGRFVPEGTIVGSSTYCIHMKPDLFDALLTFGPERWLAPGNAKLESAFVPFSRGSRACIGKSLAWLELRLAIATLWHKFDMCVSSTTTEDMEWVEHITPVTRGHLKVKIKLREGPNSVRSEEK